ncbi:hypothetical protein QF205_06065 [Luteimonas composti]|uniref:Transmembrane repetitive protein n=1 Tax=Luteimonas composti TaxID=398257 RepID=A0ABT6MQC6_9GAMM|nr:hypothetical protein [Luteimonas composti]MDH7452649.1 hypothetical protein [Luteimonas composti]
MFSSSELLEAIQRRLRKGRSIRPPRPAGEFPPGWKEWFQEDPAQPRRSARAVDAVVAVLLSREVVYPRGYRKLNGLQAFLRLWRYDWREQPVPDRRTRVASMSLSLLLHVLWLQLMVLLMVANPPGGEEAERLGEDITQVEFIGEGTPQEEGGGAQAAEEPQPQVAAAPAAAPAPAASAPQAAPPPPPPSVAESEAPPEAPPPPVAEQPLEVTETREPDSDFVLVPPSIDPLPTPPAPTPELSAPTPELRVVEVPLEAVPPPLQPLEQRDINVPDVRQRDVEVVERALPAPVPEVALRAPQSAQPAPELRREGPAIAQRDIELRAPAQGAASADAASDRDGAAPDASASGQASAGATTAGGTREAGQGASTTASSAGSGAAPQAPPGALPSPRRGDDWGDSSRNVPGGQAGSSSGLFNADGSPRLAGNTGAVGGGLPPGTITEDYEKIDRMGTWLKRPPVGYQPTAFDRFWVPHENLLEEWVRRSIKEVLIPIPGTGKRIKCTVAMLMLGGACGINDPNMLDVEADARKPPDVPFKRELQEDQDSLRPPGG